MEETYAEGFRQGFLAVKGPHRAMPAIPPMPAGRAGRTPFQIGLVRGIERAKGWNRGELFDKE